MEKLCLIRESFPIAFQTQKFTQQHWVYESCTQKQNFNSPKDGFTVLQKLSYKIKCDDIANKSWKCLRLCQKFWCTFVQNIFWKEQSNTYFCVMLRYYKYTTQFQPFTLLSVIISSGFPPQILGKLLDFIASNTHWTI